MIKQNYQILNECSMYCFQSVECLQECLVGGQSDGDPVVLRFKEIVVRILKTLQDPRCFGQQWMSKFVTRVLMEGRDEFRYNIDAADTLIKSGLINLQQLDMSLAQLMDNGNNYMAVNFAMQVAQIYLIDDRSNQFITENDLINTIEMLAKIQSHNRSAPEGLGTILDVLRQNHEATFFGDRTPFGPTVHIHNGVLQVRFLFHMQIICLQFTKMWLPLNSLS